MKSEPVKTQPESLFGVGGPPHKITQILSDECVRCSVASLFGMRREEVPHFFHQGDGSWCDPMDRWLESQGLKMTIWNHTTEPPCEWYLAYGDAATIPGMGHMVVMRNGQIWHDPSGCGISKWNAWVQILPLSEPTPPQA